MKRPDDAPRAPMIFRRLGAVALGLALAGGCGSGSGGFSPGTDGGLPGYVPGPAKPGGSRPSSPEPAPVQFPAELAGTWSGDDARGQGSWLIAFAPDGRYSMQNERRGLAISGRAAISGRQMLLQPDGGQAYTVSWMVGDGRLSLDGSVYVRTDGNQASALIGSWLSYDDLYKTLVFTTNGTFQLQNQVDGNISGTFGVNGSRLILEAPGLPATTFEWSVSDGFLRLTRADGSVSQYVRS
ncbi:MAG: hypothetical protein ACRDUV_20865 [Pseudonocardiaceae bacterium]